MVKGGYAKMKISQRYGEPMAFTEIEIGEVFFFYDKCYMRTAVIDEMNALQLQTGIPICLGPNDVVQRVNAELVIH